MKDTALLGKYRPLMVPGLILLFFLFSLALRGIPALSIPAGGFIPIYDSDTWYALRQVEVMVHSFPLYNWFDPMTAYPSGKFIDWGPLHPALAAILALLTGATTRVSIINTAMWLGPIIGACMVPVMYLLGTVIYDRRVGIVAAALVTFVSFRLFFLSSYGYVDHHGAEVLMTSLFLLAYCAILAYTRDHPILSSGRSSRLLALALTLLAGFLYFAGLLTSTTVVIILMVIGIYTMIQIIADTLEDRPTHDYLLLNAGICITAILLLLAFGIKADGFSLGRYSAGHLLACAGLIGASFALFLLSWATRGKKRLFLASCVLLGAGASLLLFIIPSLRQLLDQVLLFLSPASAYSVSIQEMNAWSPGTAWQNFNLFLLLAAGGLIILFLHLRTGRKREEIFLGVWALSLLSITILHSRFEYYLAVPFILLSALCIVETLSRGLPGLVAAGRKSLGGLIPSPDREHPEPKQPGAGPRRKGRDRKIPKAIRKDTAGDGKRGYVYPAMAVVVLIALFAGSWISLSQDIQSGMQIPYRQIDGDWTDTLSWMDGHTPSIPVDYFGRYEPGNFSYPRGSYGVMAIWDAGHWITFFSHRIPNVNPFQDNLPGDAGGAAFLLAPTEKNGDAILDNLGTRFVITDVWTATDKFTTQIPWVDPSVNITPYIRWFLLPGSDEPSQLSQINLLDDAYFQSMVVRLQVFDGSMTLPDRVQYIEYTVRKVPGPGETAPVDTVSPVITKIEERDAISAARDKGSADANPLRMVQVVVLSDRPDRPVTKVPAVSHLRLVHESARNVTWNLYSGGSVPTNISYVKVFEYVSGAHIRGNGIIELPLVTNTGRRFTYRQESVDGEFIVPYSTTGNPYDVKATGPYRIVGSTKTYEVSEEDIQSGNTVG